MAPQCALVSSPAAECLTLPPLPDLRGRNLTAAALRAAPLAPAAEPAGSLRARSPLPARTRTATSIIPSQSAGRHALTPNGSPALPRRLLALSCAWPCAPARPALQASCYGCGAALHSSDAGAPGFVEREAYQVKAAHGHAAQLLCHRRAWQGEGAGGWRGPRAGKRAAACPGGGVWSAGPGLRQATLAARCATSRPAAQRRRRRTHPPTLTQPPRPPCPAPAQVPAAEPRTHPPHPATPPLPCACPGASG